ncbi:hypothetical protein PsYK624_039700 [Phanerochaete sordida]|uniref:Uncharacterized protein n=1 Tax=Phanerochaete sordida TaxID=48140 RepID=A0A9P3G448_9APHY|nr:hypothetical protein PsYK624_039700 [Phanerochaete sordida]
MYQPQRHFRIPGSSCAFSEQWQPGSPSRESATRCLSRPTQIALSRDAGLLSISYKPERPPRSWRTRLT